MAICENNIIESLSDRDREVLDILISDYIATATPVGSKTISLKHRGRYSSATIRGILADLEAKGLLSKPHTSAGRVPTAKGVRYYVDSILKCRELSREEQEEICNRYRCSADLGVEEIINRTTKVLSAISHYVGLVGTSHMDQILFKQMQFVSLSRSRLLGIFVSQEGIVQNKIIDVEEDYSYIDLEKINNYCNSAFLGLTLEDARSKVERELEFIEKDYDRLLSKALMFSKEVFDTVINDDLVFDGESHLIDQPEFADSDKLKELLDMLEEKKQLLHILDKCKQGGGIRIFIGAEARRFELQSDSANRAMGAVSMVTAPFKKDGRILGTLGVIGPMRMQYSKVVPVVDFTAKLIEDLLN